MKTTRFFRYLWRINGILIFLVALLAAVVLARLGIDSIRFGGRKSTRPTRVDLDSKEPSGPPRLDVFSWVEGTSYCRSALMYGTARAGYVTRNYLFFNPETTEANWVFPNDNQILLEVGQVRKGFQERYGRSSTNPTLAFWYTIVDTDTNGDNQLTSEDEVTLFYSRYDGSDCTKVLTLAGIDSILHAGAIEEGTKHTVVYQVDGKWLTAVISLSDFTVQKKGELPTR